MDISLAIIISIIIIAITIASFKILNNYKINNYFKSEEFKNLYQVYLIRNPCYLELNKKHSFCDYKCSRQICKNAEIKPIDYIIKYFFSDGTKAKEYINWVKSEKERIESVEALYKQQCSYEKEYWTKILDAAPPYIKTGAGMRRLETYRKRIVSPNYTYFLFRYTSPKGNSSYDFQYGLGVKGVKALLTALENKYGKDGVSSPTTGGTPDRKWIQEERNKINRVFSNGKTLRDFILIRDNYTCQKCGNSVVKEPNLLLEVDHIVPVSKWGRSIPENLQTLCWKCNRSKSNKS